MLNKSFELVRKWRQVHEKSISGQIEVSRKKSLTRLIADSLESKIDSLCVRAGLRACVRACVCAYVRRGC